MTARDRDFSSRRRPPGPARLTWLLLLGGALALALGLFATVKAGLDYREASRSVEEVRGETRELAARVAAIQSSRGTDDSAARKAVLTAEAPPPRVLSELSLLLPSEARLDTLSLVYGSGLDLEMQVTARTAGAYDAFLDRLERSPLFTDVVPGEENREGEVRATIRASYRGAGS